MAKWTKLRDNQVGCAKENYGSAFDPGLLNGECGSDSCEGRLRSLFDRLLVAFMREKSVSKCIRPIPVLSGDGGSVDLFKLFLVGRKIGGYNKISVNDLWGFVTEECGLGFGEIPFVKFTYTKYLSELDQWLQQLNSERAADDRQRLSELDQWLQQLNSERAADDRQSRVLVELNLLSFELETGFKVLTSVGGDAQEKDIKFVEHSKEREDIISDAGESELRFSSVGGNSRKVEDSKHAADNNNKNNELLCNENATDFQPPRRKMGEKFQINCETDGSTTDDRKSCIDDDLVASAGRVIEKAVNGLNGFSTTEIDDTGKCGVEDRNSTSRSAKQVVENITQKVQMCGEAVDSHFHENFSAIENINACISKEQAVQKVTHKTDLPGNNAKDEKIFGADILDKRTVKREHDSRKRKRESDSLSGMLKWLSHIAKHSDDPAIFRMPDISKWSKYGKDEFWVQVLLVREALLVRKNTDVNSGERLLQQKKVKMHPSMYEDNVLNHKSMEKLRCSKRVPSSTKHILCSCCNSRPTLQNQDDLSKKEEEKTNLKAHINLVTAAEQTTDSNKRNCTEMPVEKQVSIGPSFQAEVPEWTGMILESDSKWLGTKMWPRENDETTYISGRDLTNCRPIVCVCQFPNSVECVRFHIAEKRFKLKQELGALFYRWGFNRMGEEVCLSWTKEEEKKFKDMMRSYSAFPNKFWNYAYRFFPGKTREKLVSYYFNAFLIQRRSYQNRVNPNNIDSDDDEKECGSIGDGFGYKALHVPGSKSISCPTNKESFELM